MADSGLRCRMPCVLRRWRCGVSAVDVLRVLDREHEEVIAKVGECPRLWQLREARDLIAELIAASRGVESYLSGDAWLMSAMQNSTHKTRAQMLRDEADAIERKDTAIARFRKAIRTVRP